MVNVQFACNTVQCDLAKKSKCKFDEAKASDHKCYSTSDSFVIMIWIPVQSQSHVTVILPCFRWGGDALHQTKRSLLLAKLR